MDKYYTVFPFFSSLLFLNLVNIIIFSNKSIRCFIIIGVGLVIENSPVSNNSMVLTNNTESFDSLYCITAAHNLSSMSYWITPDGSHVNQSTSMYSIEWSDETSSLQYMLLSVNNDSMYIEGLYQCVIQDEKQENQELYVWIYPEELQGNTRARVYIKLPHTNIIL